MDMQQLNRQTAKVNHYPTKVIQFGEGVLAAEFIWGEDVASGKLPESEMAFLHQMVQDISYNNADKYFGF